MTTRNLSQDSCCLTRFVSVTLLITPGILSTRRRSSVLGLSNTLPKTPKSYAHITGGIVSEMFSENRVVRGYTKF
jgi:hypothetical protein